MIDLGVQLERIYRWGKRLRRSPAESFEQMLGAELQADPVSLCAGALERALTHTLVSAPNGEDFSNVSDTNQDIEEGERQWD